MWDCIFGSFKLFPSSKIDFWPFLKLQKIEFGQKKFREIDLFDFASFFTILERLYTEDEVEWEGKMSASEAVSTSLRIVTAPSTSQDESKSRRLAYLNALVKMWQNREPDCDDGLRLREVMLW